MEEIAFPFRDSSSNNPYSLPYNGHLWTIPIEFYGSMVVFLTALTMGGVGFGKRVFAVGGLAFWALGKERWDLFLFLGGACIADLGMGGKEDELLMVSHSFRAGGGPSLFELLNQQIIRRLESRPVPLFGKLLAVLLTKTRGMLNALLLLTALYLLFFPGDGFHPGIYHVWLQDSTRLRYALVRTRTLLALWDWYCWCSPSRTPIVARGYSRQTSHNIWVRSRILFTLFMA
jgi:hypothetical protein